MSRGVVALSFVAGAAVMAAEMAASRMVAPYFGSSTPVWGTLITLVLGGMALGAELGGRAADRFGRLEPLLHALCAAAALLAVLPFASRFTLEAGADALLGGHIVRGAAAVVVLACLAMPPVIVLGGVGPYLLRLSVDQCSTAGQRAGRLSAASTLGSISGTLLSVFAGLPSLGTTRCMGVAALILAGSAAVLLPWPRRLLAVAMPTAAIWAAPWASAVRSTAIDSVESPYQLVQVLERPDGTRSLVFDEAYATQSILRPGQPVREEVFAHYALALAMRKLATPDPRVLLLGLGGGTAARGIFAALSTGHGCRRRARPGGPPPRAKRL